MVNAHAWQALRMDVLACDDGIWWLSFGECLSLVDLSWIVQVLNSPKSQKLVVASWSYSCFSKGRGKMGKPESNTVIFSLELTLQAPAFWSLGSRLWLKSLQVSRQSLFSISKSHHFAGSYEALWSLAFVHPPLRLKYYSWLVIPCLLLLGLIFWLIFFSNLGLDSLFENGVWSPAVGGLLVLRWCGNNES